MGIQKLFESNCILLVFDRVSLKYHYYRGVGRRLPTNDHPDPTLYVMKIWATDPVRARSKYWHLLRKTCHIQKNCGQIVSCAEIFEKKPTKVKNYGIWLRYLSRTGSHNSYQEYRETSLNLAIENMYRDMASRHKVSAQNVKIIRTAQIPTNLCKRIASTHFDKDHLKLPIIHKI